jgi:hypothetical protein
MAVLLSLLLAAEMSMGAASNVAAAPGPECHDCGPAPAYPTQSCGDGVHWAGRGPCVKRKDGTCGWTHLVCPPAAGAIVPPCAEMFCGSPPEPMRWACPDGEHTGAFGPCLKDRGGRCGWVHSRCPPPAVKSTGDAGTQPPQQLPRHASCEKLPSLRKLRTWEVTSICGPGGGPMPPPLRKLKSLGDGTFIFQGPQGCFRARYMKCHSK